MPEKQLSESIAESIKENPSLQLPKKKVNFKLILPIFAVFLVLISIPLALYLVRQRQNLREKAASETYPEGCCYNTELGNYRDCPEGQACDIPNGSCGLGGKSCNPQGSGSHKGCVGGQCVYVPGKGSDQCTSSDQCRLQATPTPPSGRECCSGTPECSQGYQCMRTDDPNCSTCQAQPGNLPGCCRNDNDCAHWEVCQSGNGACDTGKSCRSQAGCDPSKGDSDCLTGNKCVNGTCVGENTLECHADQNGVRIVNNTGQTISGTATFFSKWCSHKNNSDCFCSGTPSSEDLSGGKALKPGESWSRNIVGSGPSQNCAWQSDLKFAWCDNANHGCVSGCEEAVEPICGWIKAYNLDWQELDQAGLSGLAAGDHLYFSVIGSDQGAGTADRARFRVNSGSWQETTNKKPGAKEFYVEYVLPAGVTDFRVEAEVHYPSKGWK